MDAETELMVTEAYIKSQPWFFEFNREDAERALNKEELPTGTYLLRPSSDDSALALSVKLEHGLSHDKIIFLKDGRCTLDEVRSFDHVIALLDHYKEDSTTLTVPLTEPFPRDEENNVSFHEFEANRVDIVKKGVLGKGNFGEVWEGEWKGIPVAVKQLKPNGPTEAANFIKEAKVMHRLSHPKLVTLLAVCTSKEPILIILEKMDNSLLKVLSDDDGKTIGISRLVKMAYQVTCGMAYLEEQQYVHRDLRTANVLVKGNVIKVADFGLARDIQEGLYQGNNDSVFPWPWAAPEVLSDLKFTTKSDIWSMGVMLYEMCLFAPEIFLPGSVENYSIFGLTGQYLPEQLTNSPELSITETLQSYRILIKELPLCYQEVLDNEGEIRYQSALLKKLLNAWRLSYPRHHNMKTPKELYELMLKCWTQDPEERISFAELKKQLHKPKWSGARNCSIQ